MLSSRGMLTAAHMNTTTNEQNGLGEAQDSFDKNNNDITYCIYVMSAAAQTKHKNGAKTSVVNKRLGFSFRCMKFNIKGPLCGVHWSKYNRLSRINIICN